MAEQVEASSPDKTVRIRAAADGAVEVEVEVEVSGLDRHTDQSLARQATAAVRLALAALTAAERRRFDDVADPSPSSSW